MGFLSTPEFWVAVSFAYAGFWLQALTAPGVAVAFGGIALASLAVGQLMGVASTEFHESIRYGDEARTVEPRDGRVSP